MNLLFAELRKLLGLPTAWAGLVLGTVLAPLITVINAPYVTRMIASGANTADVGLQELGIGLIGPLILGTIVVSSEYTSTGDEGPRARQLTATLIAAPRRLRLLAAKTAALVLVVAAEAALTTALTVTANQLLHENLPTPAWGRLTAAVAYWVLTALLACSITLMTRNGIVPLTLLIVNTTVVSVSFLLSKLTDAAAYLPDVAGAQMFIRDGDFPVTMTPLVAGTVMSAWTAVFLTAGALLFLRRDA